MEIYSTHGTFTQSILRLNTVLFWFVMVTVLGALYLALLPPRSWLTILGRTRFMGIPIGWIAVSLLVISMVSLFAMGLGLLELLSGPTSSYETIP